MERPAGWLGCQTGPGDTVRHADRINTAFDLAVLKDTRRPSPAATLKDIERVLFGPYGDTAAYSAYDDPWGGDW